MLILERLKSSLSAIPLALELEWLHKCHKNDISVILSVAALEDGRKVMLKMFPSLALDATVKLQLLCSAQKT